MSNSSINIGSQKICGNNLGYGSGVFACNDPFNTLNFKSICGAGNVSISATTSGIIISGGTPAAGQTNTASNVGGGVGLYSTKVGSDLRFRSLQGIGTITVQQAGNLINISSSGNQIEAAGNAGEIQYNNGDSGNTLTANTAFVFTASTQSLTLGTRGAGLQGCYSFAQGLDNSAIGNYSHAEGRNTCASGLRSHAEGYNTCATGYQSHAEGCNTLACSNSSHAEGDSTIACNQATHAEGCQTCATGNQSHAEGFDTLASGLRSHAEGCSTVACGNFSHAEGSNTCACGVASHSEGEETLACGFQNHVGGKGVSISGRHVYACGHSAFNHSRNNGTQTVGHGALADQSAILGGMNHNIAVGNTGATIIGGYGIKLTGTTYIDTTAVDHLALMSTPINNASTDQVLVRNASTGVVGYVSKASIGGGGGISTANNGLTVNGTNVRLGGSLTGDTYINTCGNGISFSNGGIATGTNSFAEGNNTCAAGSNSHAEGSGSCAVGSSSHAEGNGTLANAQSSHAEGNNTCALATFSHVEGCRTQAYGSESHAEGRLTTTLGCASHAEGTQTCSIGNDSHAEGCQTCAVGNSSHTEGDRDVKAYGIASHAEGRCTQACSNFSHAEGLRTVVCGQGSHTENVQTYTVGYAAHAQGRYTCAIGNFSHVGGNGHNAVRKIVACGVAAFNHSKANFSLTAGGGANANYSAILGGFNHNIESGNVRATIIGGNNITLSGVDYIDHTAVSRLAIFSTPAAGGAEDVLTWNSTTKKVNKVTQGSIASDERLKTNIQPIENINLNSICGVSFDYNEKTPKSGCSSYGVIAQDIEKVFPLAVDNNQVEYNGEKYKSVYYYQLTPILLNKIKELEKRIIELEIK